MCVIKNIFVLKKQTNIDKICFIYLIIYQLVSVTSAIINRVSYKKKLYTKNCKNV